MRRLLPALLAAFLLPTGAAQVQAQAAGTAHVRIEGMKFVPERIEVAAGDTIVWTNRDFLPHSVTAAQAKVESGDLTQDKSFKFVARNKGEMKYVCRLHPVMQGVVVVK